MTARVLVNVKGRVQGVGYRQSTVERARSLGLSGWVANENDGSVRMDAQGDKDKLESLISWCWEGPRSARVSEVAVEWSSELDEERTGFKILR
jgi:acylphosphatase